MYSLSWTTAKPQPTRAVSPVGPRDAQRPRAHTGQPTAARREGGGQGGATRRPRRGANGSTRGNVEGGARRYTHEHQRTRAAAPGAARWCQARRRA
eukprot:45705-Prymnesium_polylepis.1